MQETFSPRAQRLLKVLIAVSLICSLISAWAIFARFTDTNHRRAENKAVWHAVICTIEQSVNNNSNLTHTQKLLSFRFYDGLLIDQVHTNGCGYIAARRRGAKS